ncbi:hypothetical protein WDZ17_10680 [Pseudokineococcus basanitobsidens]|uniref:Uncharacterized protein n=1 Tax=Pseudokineococcus basanitobsidens TaxID=1926649 RepID=A0ABU8RL07_9ACTN
MSVVPWGRRPVEEVPAPPVVLGRGVRTARVLLVVVGVAVMAFGVLGFVLDAGDTGPVASWVVLAAFAVGHDALFAPAVLVVVAVASRLVPDRAVPVVRAALLVSGALALVALPLVLGLGDDPSEPSALPLDYGRNLLVSLAVVWAVAALALLVPRRGRRRAAELEGARPPRG